MNSTAPPPADSSAETHSRRASASSARQVFESIVCLAIAVILFRAFEVEGYMISTGSMAPTLLGYHKRVECPNCGYHFAIGTVVDESRAGTLSSPLQKATAQTDDPVEVAPPETGDEPKTEMSHAGNDEATCPNCGRVVTGISELPVNQGDQLLVHKNAFAYQSPRRWDVAVFQNPAKPTQAYVKRIVGLPNESLDVIDGDVYADSHICRKTLTLQRAIRIPVYDNDYQPSHDTDWQPRWIPESAASPWQPLGGGFSFPESQVRNPAPEDQFAWVKYRHWTRKGARGKVFVQIEPHEGQISVPELSHTPVDFDASDGTLSCAGALSAKWREKLSLASHDPVFLRTLEKLYEKSHLTPVTDGYGYNEPADSDWAIPVRDLMISLQLETPASRGAFAIEMADGRQVFRTVFDFATHEVKLFVDGVAKAERIGKWQRSEAGKPSLIEMSLMDRQVLVVDDGHEPFLPWQMDETPKDVTPPDNPVRFGIRGETATVSRIQLFRDVYYTHKGNHESVSLGSDQFYVLGDNSPISFDSRSWVKPTIDSQMLIGKPLFLHLPSRPGEVHFRGRTYHIRIPDFSRIRYIR